MSLLTRYALSGATVAGDSRTVSLTLASATLRKLVVCVGLEEASPREVTGATYDGAAMTQFGNIRSSDVAQRWFYLDIDDGKAASAYDLVMTFSGSSNRTAYAAWVTAGEPLGAPEFFSEVGLATNSVSKVVPRDSGDLLLSVYTGENAGTTPNATPLSNFLSTSGGGFRLGAADRVESSTGDLTVTWGTASNDDIAIAVVNVTNSAAPSGPSAPKHRRRIVGHRPRAKTAPRLRSAFASILSGNSVTPATLPPDYYTPRNPVVSFPSPVSATVTFPDAVTPTVSFTP